MSYAVRIDVDQIMKLKTSLLAGIVNINDLIKFLEVIEFQSPPSKKKTTRIYYHMGKPIKDDNYYKQTTK